MIALVEMCHPWLFSYFLMNNVCMLVIHLGMKRLSA